jgi:Family of unknown function (DUF6131)
MIVIGLICLLVGLFLGIHILWIAGIALLVVGLILAFAGHAGHPVGGRAHWF